MPTLHAPVDGLGTMALALPEGTRVPVVALGREGRTEASSTARETGRRRLLRLLRLGIGIVAAIEVVAIGLRYALQVLLARVLGADEFGHYTLALTWSQTLAIPAGLGISSLVIRYVPQYLARGEHQRLRQLLRWSQLTTFGVATLIATLAIVVASVAVNENRSELTIALAFMPAIAMSTLSAEILRGSGRLFTSRVVPSLVQPTLLAIATGGVFLLLGDLDASDAMWCFVLVMSVSWITQWAMIRHNLPVAEPSEPTSVLRRREWLSVSVQLLVIKFFQMLLNLSDILIVGFLLGPTPAGIYAAATRTAVLASLVTQALNLAVPPMVARSAAVGDLAGVEDQLRWSARIAVLPSTVLALLLLVFPDTLLGIFGAQFREGATALAILAVGRLISSFTGPVGSVLSVTGHQRVNLWAYGLASVMQVSLNFVLIPSFGLPGAAFCNAAAVATWNLILYIAVMRVLNVRLWPIPLVGDVK